MWVQSKLTKWRPCACMDRAVNSASELSALPHACQISLGGGRAEVLYKKLDGVHHQKETAARIRD